MNIDIAICYRYVVVVSTIELLLYGGLVLYSKKEVLLSQVIAANCRCTEFVLDVVGVGADYFRADYGVKYSHVCPLIPFGPQFLQFIFKEPLIQE